jgi:hypothetical protein
MTTISSDADDQTKLALARAFDSAWTQFLEREGPDADTEANRGRLARRIVALAKAGETDEAQLSETALIYLSVLTEAARLGSAPSRDERDESGPTPDPILDAPRAQAFGPDALAAMTDALELCLDALPLRLPSDVAGFLTNAIMSRAATGDRDAASLSHHALEALKAR